MKTITRYTIGLLITLCIQSLYANPCKENASTASEALAAGMECYHIAINQGEKERALNLNLAEKLLLDADRKSETDGEFTAANYYLSLLQCSRIRDLVKGETEIKKIIDQDEVKRDAFCTYRRLASGAILSLDFGTINSYSHPERLEETFADYEQCVTNYLDSDLDDSCMIGTTATAEKKKLSIDDKIDEALKKEMDFYFKSTASPLYSAFFEKIDISKHFLADAKKKIEELGTVRTALQSDLNTTSAEYNAAVKKVDHEFSRYIKFNKLALELVDTITILTSGAISEFVAEKVDNALKNDAKIALKGLKTQKAEIANYKRSIDFDSLKKEAVKMCRTYYCSYWGLMEVDGESFVDTTTICDNNQIFGLAENPVCKGSLNLEGNKAIKIDDWCQKMATGQFANLARFMKKKNTTDELIECLKIDI